mmetsp:Transcript_21138/g.66261  ORF Transcript_21138/g.66261 Transcript_21138/m.66261 type:complete len:346 (+) Transcript_21138:294-1331(+)
MAAGPCPIIGEHTGANCCTFRPAFGAMPGDIPGIDEPSGFIAVGAGRPGAWSPGALRTGADACGLFTKAGRRALRSNFSEVSRSPSRSDCAPGEARRGTCTNAGSYLTSLALGVASGFGQGCWGTSWRCQDRGCSASGAKGSPGGGTCAFHAASGAAARPGGGAGGVSTFRPGGIGACMPNASVAPTTDVFVPAFPGERGGAAASDQCRGLANGLSADSEPSEASGLCVDAVLALEGSVASRIFVGVSIVDASLAGVPKRFLAAICWKAGDMRSSLLLWAKGHRSAELLHNPRFQSLQSAVFLRSGTSWSSSTLCAKVHLAPFLHASSRKKRQITVLRNWFWKTC